MSATLAERLGHAPDARLLIVNCDDLGSSHAANQATDRAMRLGVATSATLMVPCPWAREAARLFEGRPIGVHLTLTAEYPGYRWRSLTGRASLHDDEGFMPATAEAALARIEAADARAECRAQVDQALAWGVDVTHLDTHMGVVQMREDLFDIYLDLAVEYGLAVRMFNRRLADALGFDARGKAEDRGIAFPDHWISPWPRVTREVVAESMPKLRAGVTEIFGHPVLEGEELRGYDQEHADIRAADAACFVDPSVAELIEAAGARPISFRPLRDLMRRGN
jgi:chitin disaccharide deacetylase